MNNLFCQIKYFFPRSLNNFFYKARRLKMGGRRNKGFVVENQPWSLKVTSLEIPKDDKKDIKPTFVTKEFQGKKEGGIGE